MVSIINESEDWKNKNLGIYLAQPEIGSLFKNKIF
jgi:hypothetical protein